MSHTPDEAAQAVMQELLHPMPFYLIPPLSAAAERGTVTTLQEESFARQKEKFFWQQNKAEGCLCLGLAFCICFSLLLCGRRSVDLNMNSDPGQPRPGRGGALLVLKEKEW